MEPDPLRHIEAHVHDLPRNQQRVAEYLLHHWERALYETSVTIAKKVGVGQSTVVRTVMNLGYRGFPEFQSALRTVLHNHFFTVGQINAVSHLQKGCSLEQRIAQVFDQNHANLNTALRDLGSNKVSRAADLIWKGRRIFILGLRTSGALAHYFGLHLSMIRPNVIILTSDNLLLENIRTAGDRDVVVAFSFIRYLRKTIEAVTYAKERGCHIVGMTDALTAPLAGISDILFLVPVASLYFGNSYVAPCALLDVLLSVIGQNNKREVLQALRSMEDGYAKLKIFFSCSEMAGSPTPSVQKRLPQTSPPEKKRTV